MKPRHKRLIAIAAGVVALGIAAALVLSAFQQNLVFFFTPSQVAANEAPQGSTFRVGGMVEKGSVKREGVEVRFVVTDTAKAIPVVFSVNAAGTGLAYCGYIGGVGADYGSSIALDSQGGAYVTGYTKSDEATFPVAGGPDLTYNGGTSLGDAFLAKVASGGASLDYCGYIGGCGDDAGFGIAVDAAYTATVAGYTNSTQSTFPVTVGPDLTHNGNNDAFVAKVSASDFTLGATPPAVEICAGDNAQYTVTVGSIGGFTDAVTLSASGQPAGATTALSVNPVTPPVSSVLTIGITAGAAGGSYGITILGTASGGISHSVEAALNLESSGSG